VSSSKSDESERTGWIAAAASRPSPAEKFDVDRTGPAARSQSLHAQQQRFAKLNEHCDQAVAEIRASLERISAGQG